MKLQSPGSKFRELISGSNITVMPGVFNAVTAKLAAAAGFDALYLSGAGVTNALTGYPDIALLTLTEMVQQAHYVATAVTQPVIADADTGYGEAHNVMRAVAELENSGLAGIHLEDQVAPKRCGHLDGKQIIATADMQVKIRAAVRARKDSDFFLLARTDARSLDGIDAAIERANRYLDAGADGIFAESLQSKSEFEEFAKRVKAPLMANMTEFGKTPLISASEFEQMGYAMVIFPMTAFRTMMKTAERVYAELKNTGTQAALIEEMQTRAELYDLIGYQTFNEIETNLLS